MFTRTNFNVTLKQRKNYVNTYVDISAVFSAYLLTKYLSYLKEFFASLVEKN